MAPLLPSIEKELHFSHSVAGSFFLLISAGYFVSLAGSGFISARLTHRKTIILSSVTVGLALLGICFSQNLWTIRLAPVLLGLAAGLYLPSGIATITHMVSSRHWARPWPWGWQRATGWSGLFFFSSWWRYVFFRPVLRPLARAQYRESFFIFLSPRCHFKVELLLLDPPIPRKIRLSGSV